MPRAPEDGTVTRVTDDYIELNGKTKIEIYNNFPLNLKCPSGDMTINILRGYDQVWRGKIKDYDWQFGDKIQSVNIYSKKSKWQRIRAFRSHQNDKKLYNIKFKSGRNVVVTEDHSLITIDMEGNLVPIFPDDCVPGKTKCPIAMFPELPQAAFTYEYDDYDHGVLAGLYLSEGSLDRTCIQIAASEPSHQNDILELMNRITTKNEAHIYTSSVRLFDANLAHWLYNSFRKYAHLKVIPNVFLIIPLSFAKV